MILFDVTHTSHTDARTGIQQLTRRLYGAAQDAGLATGVTFDKRWGAWRSLDAGEAALAREAAGGGNSRSAKWTRAQRWRGRFGKWLGRIPPFPGGPSALVAPELFSKEVGAAYRDFFLRIPGPRVAVFYDTIPLTHPELIPAGMVARFPSYLEELRQFDAIAAISDYSRESLEGFWRWTGAADAPPVVTIAPGVERPHEPAGDPPESGPPQVLAVGTIEGRKNHTALFDAAETLWAEGVAFELHVVGITRPETAGVAIARMHALIAARRPLVFHGPIDDVALAQRWKACRFSVYPSVIEGFGLPVAESAARGRPCICSAAGATGEAARGGGCVPLESVDAPSLARAIRRLLEDGAAYASLRDETANRTVRTWDDYARDMLAFVGTVKRRGL